MTIDGTSIAGIGWTSYSRNSGVSVEQLAVDAIRAAADDAGLDVRDIDGLVTFGLCDTAYSGVVGTSLGLKDLHYFSDHTAGGNVACAVVIQAAMAVATGQAKHVAVYRALNGASGIRYGGGSWSQMMATTSLFSDSEPQFLDTCGLTMPAQHFALLARRHMVKYGTDHRDFAAVAITSRNHAALNDRAQMRKPMTLDDYEASPWIANPFRLLDCCVQTDGGCALIVTSADRARDLRKPPVRIRSGASAGRAARGVMWTNFAEDHARCYADQIADRLFAGAGIARDDIDFAEIYDCFTYSVLVQLEDFGFCAKGDAGAFFREGHASLGGSLPINTHGGLLSEGYIHGLNSVTEAVIQLRGEAGARQVNDAAFGLVTAGGAANSGSALILGVM
jgi:acetyl-CoA acetyltransferase